MGLEPHYIVERPLGITPCALWGACYAFCWVLNCNAKQLPTVADIESDLKTRLNNLRSSTRQESVENFTIPGKGRVVIPADRVKFKRDGRLMSYRKFQNDLMMLGGRVTKVTAKTTSAGYATEVTELQVELK